MPTFEYTSISVRVQDYLNALSASMNKPFVIVGPDGKVIEDKLKTIPVIGLATRQDRPAEPFGFKTPRSEYSKSAPSKWVADGELILDIKPEELPTDLAGIPGPIWLIALTDDTLLEYYMDIAAKLDTEFKDLGVTIIVIAGIVTDADPAHELPTTGPMPVCHIIPHEN